MAAGCSAYFPHDYVNEIDPIDMAKAFAHARQDNPGTTELMHLYGIGDHGGGPTRAMLDSGDRWLSPDKAYARLNFGDAGSFFSAVEKQLDTRARAGLELPDAGCRRHQIAASSRGPVEPSGVER